MAFRVAAAIDFGTHGSGFAWAVQPVGPERPEDLTIDTFDQWDDQPVTYPKDLSALLVTDDGTIQAWGHAARRAKAKGRPGTVHHGFKMWLRPDEDEAASLIGGGLVGTPEQALPLITGYLGCLREKALEQITAGGFLPEHVRWCLTVPAIWTDTERNYMRQAAEAAGFPTGRDQLLLVAEPEAATIYCAQDRGAGVGGIGTDATLVVDCGGGTVDIAAYRDRGNGTLEELCPPSGGRQGSNYINRRFQSEVLRPRLGARAYDALREQEEHLLKLMDEFEREKVAFRADSEDRVIVPLSAAASRILQEAGAIDRLAAGQGGRRDDIVIEAQTMRTLFEGTVEPLVKQVLTRVRELLGMIADGETLRVVVVGGFAQSHYVRSRLKGAVAKEFDDRVKVVVPQAPARAVLEGAVHYACRPEVVHSRVARLSYAVKVRREQKRWFPNAKERALPKVKGEGRERFRDGHLDVFVRKGESVLVGDEVTVRYQPVLRDDAQLHIELFSSPHADVATVQDPGVRPMGDLVVDITESMGRPVDERAIDVIFRFGGTEIEVLCVNPRTGHRERTTLAFRSRLP